MDGILSFSVLPLRLASLTGLVAIWFALAGIIMAMVVRVLGFMICGWARMGFAIRRRSLHGWRPVAHARRDGRVPRAHLHRS